MNSIIEAIYNFSISSPDKLCLIEETRKISYSDFFTLIKKYAYCFKNIHNISKGDKVIIECSQTIEYFAIEFSLHLLGAVFVPLENKCSDSRISDVYNLCKSKLVILNEKRKIDNIEQIIEYKDVVSEDLDFCEEFAFPSENDISEILFSTGTTGKEKGIVLTHKSDVAVAENIIYGVSMKSDNVEIMPLPINHSHGLRSCYANLLNGSTIVLLDSVMNIGFFQESLDKYHANAIDLVPSALTVLLKLSKCLLNNYKDQIRYVEFGSAALLENDKNKIKELLPNSHLYNFYGSTESGRSAVYDFNSNTIKEKCIGKPTKNSKLVILDNDNNEIDSSIDKVGKIATAGDMNMVGYYCDESETNKVTYKEYIVSNDVAYIDLDGYVILLGRENDVINIGGKKVSPEEIENIAKKIDIVDDCACIAIEDERLGQAPKLFVQYKKGVEEDSKIIKKYLENNLERFKVPKLIVKIDKIPRTFNGKIIKKNLK